MAIESEKIIAWLIAEPYNLKASSWKLTLSKQIEETERYSSYRIKHFLLDSILKNSNYRSKSWFFKCPAVNTKDIALMREFGFKILKTYTLWKPPEELECNLKIQNNDIMLIIK